MIHRAAPLGATPFAGGTIFSLYSRHATGVDLLLFDRAEDGKPTRTISLNPLTNRTAHYWHTHVPGVRAGQIYGYRVHGPQEPSRGLRFDSEKVLLDPYGRGLVRPKGYVPTAACRPGDNTAIAMKNVVVDIAAYDWEDDAPPRIPSARTFIYEMHVAGFTKNPNSGVRADRRGTYAGLIEKIPYLQSLGVNAVELLPVFAFDPLAAPAGRVNYWGYQPVAFFAPHPDFSADATPLGPVNEFRDMVKALHRVGIEVVLDVVFNHTAEGNQGGPTFGFRGIDNPTYYILDATGERYLDFSGCGNSLNANHPVVRRMILDSLRYWVREMHVDGFRFDLASVLTRDSAGVPMRNAPVLWDIDTDPVLAGTKLIAEAWDAAGLYQVGSFLGDRWKEWNGRFRDDARDFLRGVPGSAGRFADRMLGSHDVYRHKNREAEQSINFVTCHDGFTLNDLVSYNEKHNEANGEGNRDGCNDNRSWNCGVEGLSDDPAIENLRNRQVKNFLVVTTIALGVPMIAMGDEVRRTQGGNNNAYCHDDASVWFDWSLVERHADVHRFLTLLLQRRTLRSTSAEDRRLSLTEQLANAEKAWHGVKLNEPDWSESSHTIAFGTVLPQDRLDVHWIMNADSQPHTFELPGSGWRRWLDTAKLSPEDISDWRVAPQHAEMHYRAEARSIVLLFRERVP